MPRTLPAALTTVMDAGAYEPYIRVVVNNSAVDAGADTVQPLAYRLEALTATIRIAKFSDDLTQYRFFRIVRGALINGTPSTISSIWFSAVEITFNGKFVNIKGEIMPKQYVLVDPTEPTYQQAIEFTISDISPVNTFTYEGTAGWKAYKFYPPGRTPVFSPGKKLFTILQQKYLIFATENGFDGTDNNMFFFVATDTRATDYTFTDLLFNGNEHTESRRLLSRDEASVITANGVITNPIHNLGFLASTASQPTNTANPYVGARSSKLPVHLKYRTGDHATCAGDGSGLNELDNRINVIEVLDLESTPAWYQIIESLVWYGGTEGGALPSTIEAAAPYTPLATGNFDGVLSSNDNNLQAAMETIDDHEHGANSANSNISPTTANVSAAVNTRYFADISGLTASRNFIVPAGAVGDIIELNIKTGDDTYALIVIGDTGITINGGSSATEWSRLFITGETIQLIADTTSNWIVMIDKRIPCFAEMDRITTSITTNTAGTKTTVDWNNTPRDRGNIADLTNNRFNIRRAGQYEVSFQYRPANGVTDQKYISIILFGGASGATEFGYAVNRVSVSGSAATLCVISSRPITCAVADQIVAQFATEEANIGMLRNDAGDQSTGGSWYSIKEVL